MKKLVVVGASAIAASTIGLLSAGFASSQPADANQANVIGEPYYKAVKILKGMGIGTGFGGSVGSDLPQAQCMVASQKVVGSGGNVKMLLNLDCTKEAAAQMAEQGTSGSSGGVSGGRQVGSNGVTTVQATPVGPQPGMQPAG